MIIVITSKASEACEIAKKARKYKEDMAAKAIAETINEAISAAAAAGKNECNVTFQDGSLFDFLKASVKSLEEAGYEAHLLGSNIKITWYDTENSDR